MHILGFFAFLLMTFTFAYQRKQTLLEIAPWLLCVIGLICYVLAFFHRMSWIDGFLTAGGLASVGCLVRDRREGHPLGKACRRLFGDPYLWFSLLLLAVMLFCLRGEQILEWDGYNFWGPDTKSLFYRNGFAPRYSNPAFLFGNYTPFGQIIWWWFTHISGSFQERFLFWGYYLFCALLLLSLGEQFRRRWPGTTFPAAALIPVCAVLLPGVACTAWYRALVVDPMMAMLFGTVLVQIVHRPRKDVFFWKLKLLTFLCALVLTKSIGILWGILAVAFFFFWWRKEYRDRRFLIAAACSVAVFAGSWTLFCKVLDRSGYLADSFSDRAAQRLGELMNGTFLSSGDTKGYLLSYAKAFFCMPIHKEHSLAIDLSPFALLVFFFFFAFFLGRLGLVPKGKLRCLLLFMAITELIIYSVVVIGQLTMFYYEQQYLDPTRAVILMTRYCSPANIGILMLLSGFAAGNAAGVIPSRCQPSFLSRVVPSLLVAALLLSCTSYKDIYRRFCHDELDPQRIELRASYESQFRSFVQRIQGFPLDQPSVRVMLVTRETEANPIVINRASPISIDWLVLTGDTGYDLSELTGYGQIHHVSYLYIQESGEEFLQNLAPYLGHAPELNTLYRFSVGEDGSVLLCEVQE